MEIVNLGGFSVARAIAMDGDGFEHLTVVVKGTFDFWPRVQPCDEQPPVLMVDSYGGDPATSALVTAGEGVPFKPATDVLLTGAAYPSEKSATEAVAGFRLGALQKGIQVFGDRHWESVLGVHRASSPVPFGKMPLIYERAFGGRDDSNAPLEVSADNPAGVGFRSRRSRRPVAKSPLPNLEFPRNRLEGPDGRPPPAGFGPLAPGWGPRRLLAGTMDDRWLRSRAPLPPEDFDLRFHQVAPRDQIYPGYVKGGEPVVLLGVRPEGTVRFALPEVRPTVSIRIGAEEFESHAPCDTVLIDAERGRLSLIWRAGLRVHGRVPDIRWIRVAVASP